MSTGCQTDHLFIPTFNSLSGHLSSSGEQVVTEEGITPHVDQLAFDLSFDGQSSSPLLCSHQVVQLPRRYGEDPAFYCTVCGVTTHHPGAPCLAHPPG